MLERLVGLDVTIKTTVPQNTRLGMAAAGVAAAQAGAHKQQQQQVPDTPDGVLPAGQGYASESTETDPDDALPGGLAVGQDGAAGVGGGDGMSGQPASEARQFMRQQQQQAQPPPPKLKQALLRDMAGVAVLGRGSRAQQPPEVAAAPGPTAHLARGPASTAEVGELLTTAMAPAHMASPVTAAAPPGARAAAASKWKQYTQRATAPATKLLPKLPPMPAATSAWAAQVQAFKPPGAPLPPQQQQQPPHDGGAHALGGKTGVQGLFAKFAYNMPPSSQPLAPILPLGQAPAAGGAAAARPVLPSAHAGTAGPPALPSAVPVSRVVLLEPPPALNEDLEAPFSKRRRMNLAGRQGAAATAAAAAATGMVAAPTTVPPAAEPAPQRDAATAPGTGVGMPAAGAAPSVGPQTEQQPQQPERSKLKIPRLPWLAASRAAAAAPTATFTAAQPAAAHAAQGAAAAVAATRAPAADIDCSQVFSFL